MRRSADCRQQKTAKAKVGQYLVGSGDNEQIKFSRMGAYSED